jgi:hypothetical protein
MSEPTTTMQERVATVADYLLSRMPDDLVAECLALVELNPDDAGIRLAHDPQLDRFDFLWVGRWLGSVPGPWLRDGTDPGA